MESTLLPQPPPDAPAPPPGPEAKKSWDRWENILLLGFLSILITLVAGTVQPTISRTKIKADQTEATHHAKQVFLALIQFDATYGTYPDASTISAVIAKTSTTLALGNSNSNELFRQLIATEVTKSEKIFWAKSAGSPRKPNDILGVDTLKKGECGFTYIAGLSSSSDSAAPVLMAPVIPGTREFDPKPFKGKAVIVRNDGSAKTEPIDKNGHVMIGTMNLFDSRQRYWNGKPPDIKWPE